MRGNRLTLLALLAAGRLASAPAARSEDVRIDADTFGGIEARSIGPAAMSGRISAIDAVPGDRLTIWVGAAGGGLWKSVDGGLEFKPVFDKYNQSIGAITVDPKNPKTVWVGTGETCVRNCVSVGDGLYRTTDGGENWQKVGLADSERIAKIVVHPADSNTVLACATGHAFDYHPERGVFRTKDGGKTWEKTLFVNARHRVRRPRDRSPGRPDRSTRGCGSSAAKPYFFTSGGPGSGLYKSTDGGKTWRKVTKGLPEGELGRIALAVSPARTSVVYATVEAKKSAALPLRRPAARAGRRRARRASVLARPFYFSHLVADPKDWKRIYKPGFSLYRERGRRQDLRQRGRQHPLRRPRPLGGPAQHGQPRHRHRRRRLRLARPRREVALRGQPARLAVLPRELRHGVAVQRLRRPAGQQHVVRALAPPRRHPEQALELAHRRRRLLGVRRPRRHRPRLQRVPGREPLPHPQVHARAEGHQALAEGGGAEVPLQLEHAHPPLPERHRARSTTARSSSSARRTAAISWERISPDLTTNDPAKQKQTGVGRPDRSTTRPPRTTARSSRSPSRRRTATSSGWAPTTATCR